MRLYARIEIEPFDPHPTTRNTHMQTLLGATVRKQQGITFRRERLDTPDGDFLDIDFADVHGATWAQLGDGRPIAMMLHGLEGNARSGPAHEIYRYLSRRGVRCLGMNMRSCSGELNRTAQLYHAGATGDLGFVHEWLLDRFPGVPIGIVAISLGGNILLKYLGENGNALDGKLRAAVAISPPFDLLAGNEIMKRGAGLLYTQTMLRPLKAKVRGLRHVLEDKIDVDAALKASTFEQFDDVCTAPLHGYNGVEDYYIRTSSGQFLPGIRVPTLLLRAVDDPFFEPTDIPHDLVENNPFLYGGFPEHGGHVGFVEGRLGGTYTYWAERQAAQFMSLVL